MGGIITTAGTVPWPIHKVREASISEKEPGGDNNIWMCNKMPLLVISTQITKILNSL